VNCRQREQRTADEQESEVPEHDRTIAEPRRAVFALAANYFDSIGDQFGCLSYIEDTMRLVAHNPQARAVVLDCTHDIMIGNS
jgi:hypothetical protein